MVQFLIFHHRERPHFGYRIRTPYKKGDIIEVYEDGALIDKIHRQFGVDWSYVRIIRVICDMYYDEGIKYYRKGRILFKMLSKEKRRQLRKTGTTELYKEEFYKALEGE